MPFKFIIITHSIIIIMMNNKRSIFLIILLVLLAPILWFGTAFESKADPEPINTSVREVPQTNFNGYFYFYQGVYDGTTEGLTIKDLKRDEDIELNYTYYINNDDPLGMYAGLGGYDDWVATNGSERLDYLNFYLVDDKDEFLTNGEHWQVPIDQSTLLFDQEVTGTMTLDHNDFQPLLDDKADTFVLKVLWGNTENSQIDEFLFANSYLPMGPYKPITLTFEGVEEFYEPEIWFLNPTGDSNYFKGGGSYIYPSYDLPYKTYATEGYITFVDAEDTSFVRTYTTSEISPDFDISNIQWQSEGTNIGFEISKLPNAYEYEDRSKFNISLAIDWEQRDNDGNPIQTGHSDSLDTTRGDKYTTYIYEDLEMDVSFDSSIVTPGDIVTFNYDYVANRPGVEFQTNKADLYVDRLDGEGNAEDTKTISLIDQDITEPTFDLGYSGNGSIELDTSTDTSFYQTDSTYKAYIMIDDLRYDHWGFVGYEWVSDEALFVLTETDIDTNVGDQDLWISNDQAGLNYGEDIIIDYDFHNFTEPYLTSYEITFTSVDDTRGVASIIRHEDVNDYIKNSSGTTTISSDEYDSYLTEEWEGYINVSYTLSNVDGSLTLDHSSNDEFFKFNAKEVIVPPVIPGDDNNDVIKYIAIGLITFVVLFIVVVVVIYIKR